MTNPPKILVTGSAGFIGFHLVRKLAESGQETIGLDNLNAYYDVNLKISRLRESGIAFNPQKSVDGFIQSSRYQNYRFIPADLVDREKILTLFEDHKFDVVYHLAAQAGVRYSIENPFAYTESNIDGFIHILEGCRRSGVKHLVFASSSSVYGMNRKMPFSVADNVDHPVSLYSATKKANELMAHSYAHLYGMPVTGLRFFTVYGPWGRPDMAYFQFTRFILEGRPIDVYNNGEMKRDFTYIDDIVDGILRSGENVPATNPLWDGEDTGSSTAPYRIYNIGSDSPVSLLEFIETIESSIGKKAQKNMMPMQKGDVPATWADISHLRRDTGYEPRTNLKKGISAFVDWYRSYYSA